MKPATSTPIVTRKVTNVSIIHNDLGLGAGKVAQRRGDKTADEQLIELTFIFRTLEEIKFLDPTRYPRVQLHQDGQNKEYWFDAGCGFEANDLTVIQPYLTTHLGRWCLVEVVDAHARGLIRQLRKELVAAEVLVD